MRVDHLQMCVAPSRHYETRTVVWVRGADDIFTSRTDATRNSVWYEWKQGGKLTRRKQLNFSVFQIRILQPLEGKLCSSEIA